MSTLLLLTLNEQEEKTIDKIISAILTVYHLKPCKRFLFLFRECLFRDWK